MDCKLRSIYCKYRSTAFFKENIRIDLAHGDDSNYYEQIKGKKQIDYIENGKKRAFALFNEIFNSSETIQILFFAGKYTKKTKLTKFLYKNQFKVVDNFVTDALDEDFDSSENVLIVETKKKILE